MQRKGSNRTGSKQVAPAGCYPCRLTNDHLEKVLAPATACTCVAAASTSAPPPSHTSDDTLSSVFLFGPHVLLLRQNMSESPTPTAADAGAAVHLKDTLGPLLTKPQLGTSTSLPGTTSRYRHTPPVTPRTSPSSPYLSASDGSAETTTSPHGVGKGKGGGSHGKQVFFGASNQR